MIASNIAVMLEVVEDAGLLVDPWDVEALSQAMALLCSDQNLRRDLRQKGLTRAQRFSWAKAAEQTIEIYRQVAIE